MLYSFIIKNRYYVPIESNVRTIGDVCLYVCIYVYIEVFTYVRMHVCMYVLRIYEISTNETL